MIDKELKGVGKEVVLHERALKEARKLKRDHNFLLRVSINKLKLGKGDTKAIVGVSQMSELRLNKRPAWRTYFTETDIQCIIWAFGLKDTQDRDIEKAKKRYRKDGYS